MRPSGLTPVKEQTHKQHPPRRREDERPCTQACDLCDYTLAADSGPLLTPFSERPDSEPFTEQRLIIVLGRQRLTNIFILSLTESAFPLVCLVWLETQKVTTAPKHMEATAKLFVFIIVK